jgi:hypothetical protein
MKQTHRVTAGVGVVVLGWLAGCAGGPAGPVGEATPAPWTPLADDQAVGPRPASLPQPCDLTQEGAVCRGVAGATVFDTRLVVPQVQEPDAAVLRRIRDVVPPHQTPRTLEEGEPNALVAGGVLDEGRVEIVRTWPSISATGWNPPDPTLAVGPDHVVATVNMQIAFYSKAGVQQFSLPLNDTGNPGFFETVGARGFTFDPKCFYDHGAGRFVVMAPEVYSGTQEAYICIAVSDDSDPNGVWYKYRTDAVLNVNGINYWWDYPGFGFDGQAYYVTSNLFAMTSGPFGGVGFRIFDKAAMLAGAPASYSTLRDGSAGSVQVAQHFGTPIAPYFVSTGSSTSLRVRAITNPLTAPAIVTATVSVPAYSGPTSAPTSAGGLSTVDSRIMNAQWRNGNLYACHTILSGGRNVARWYHMSTGTWPTSGGVSLLQSGNVAGGGTLHAFFPAIYSNAAGDVGMVFGTSSGMAWAAGVARVVDVLANDWHSGGQALVIDSFQAASVRGGAITRSVGTGPGGRDQLRYVPPMGFNGFDSFTYTVRDTSGSTNSTFVGAFTTDPATFRVPENPSNAQAGVNVSYYVLQGPTAVPDFSALTPYLRTSLSRIDIGSSANAFATSGRAGDVGAVFEGFINVPTSGYYTLAVTSDDGSRLYLGDTLLINNDGVHGMREAWAAAGLQSGRHRVRVEFFQGGGNNGLIVSMGAYTGLRSTVQDSQWFRVVCDPDANADGNVDQDDVSYLVNVVGGGPNPSGMDPDFNGDGNVDQDDVQALINVVAGGPCP